MSFLKGFFLQKSIIEKAIVFLCCMSLGGALGSSLSILFQFFIKDNLLFLKISQGVLALCVFLFPSLLGAYFFSYHPKHYLQIKFAHQSFFCWLAVGIIICSIPAIDLITEWNTSITLPERFSAIEQWMRTQEMRATLITQQLLSMNTLYDYFSSLLVMALLPALCEEFFFRGFLQKSISKFLNIHITILITAILFSSIHLQFYGFFPRMILGILLGYITYWSGSIIPTIVAHFMNNAVIVTFAFVIRNTSSQLDYLGATNQWVEVFASIVVVSLLLWKFWKCHLTTNVDAHE